MSKRHHRKTNALLRQVRMEAPLDYSDMLPEDPDAEPEREPEPETALGAKAMTIDAIAEQLDSIKKLFAAKIRTELDGPNEFLNTKVHELWNTDIQALEAAAVILDALRDEQIEDAEALRDMIFDYRLLGEQFKRMHRKFNIPTPPQRIGGYDFCPTCEKPIQSSWLFCTRCGERISRR